MRDFWLRWCEKELERSADADVVIPAAELVELLRNPVEKVRESDESVLTSTP